MTGLQVGLMFAGVVVIETDLRLARHRPVHRPEHPRRPTSPPSPGVTLVLGVGYVVINTVVDILQAVADPRIAVE